MSDYKNTSAIIQARMGSTRLAGKVLEPIRGLSILRHIIERLKKIEGIQKIIVATTDHEADDVIEHYCKDNNILYFRGDRDDVLNRFIGAAEKFSVDIIVRVCADSPLFDIPFMAFMIERHHASRADITYTLSPVPLGSVQEVVSLKALKQAYRETTDVKCREHVTPYLKENPVRYKNHVIEVPDYILGNQARLTIDTAEDLELIKKIYEYLYKPGSIISLKDALDLLNSNPSWLDINSHVRQKAWNE